MCGSACFPLLSSPALFVCFGLERLCKTELSFLSSFLSLQAGKDLIFADTISCELERAPHTQLLIETMGDGFLTLRLSLTHFIRVTSYALVFELLTQQGSEGGIAQGEGAIDAEMNLHLT